MCVLCHTPQTADPDSGNTVDFPVMVHKIHREPLPSVEAGKPYQIIGFQGSVADYSTVVHPSDVRRCEVCHQQDSGATQATAYLTRPTRVSCGSCHDDVNFATGVESSRQARRSAITNARPVTFPRENWPSTPRSRGRTSFLRIRLAKGLGSGHYKSRERNGRPSTHSHVHREG